MPYVDGFVIPLPKRNVQVYRRIALKAGKLWKEHGALEYRECVGDDMKSEGARSFPQQIRTKPGETVVFSWIVYNSKSHRDKVNAAVMKDPRMIKMMGDGVMPFNVKRMVYGGFKTVVDL